MPASSAANQGETGREHIHAEVYAREAEKARAEALRAAKAEAAQILAEAHAERQRAAQEAAEALRAARAAQEATRAAEAAKKAAEDQTKAMIADLRSLEREIRPPRVYRGALDGKRQAQHGAALGRELRSQLQGGPVEDIWLGAGRTSGIASWPIGTRTRNTIRRQPRSRSRTRSMALARSLVTTNPRRKSRKPREIQRTEHVNYPLRCRGNTLPIGPKGALRSIMCYCAGKNPPLADQKTRPPQPCGGRSVWFFARPFTPAVFPKLETDFRTLGNLGAPLPPPTHSPANPPRKPCAQTWGIFALPCPFFS